MAMRITPRRCTNGWARYGCGNCPFVGACAQKVRAHAAQRHENAAIRWLGPSPLKPLPNPGRSCALSSARTAGCGPWSRPVVVERDGAVAAFPAPRAAGPGQGVTAIGGMRRGRALFFDNAGRRREEIEVFVSLWRRLAIPESLTR